MMKTSGITVPIAALAPVDRPPPLPLDPLPFDGPELVFAGELLDALADPMSLAWYRSCKGVMEAVALAGHCPAV
jgi:hypothetical protein